ncbi:response regulator [Aquiflexum sp. TKW24L]|uniref:response regulator n=1 Tax=Aquiflexum sp. TKW24L TaxID=2942212 RepID=UPI0020BEA0EF|nr:response regulator [Aquiflexum sp. TKW24L]MCL6261567.1 response regulator [Aquiflexum sp. TKW24L]
MNTPSISLLLADDDPDDCILFQEALDELPIDASLTIVNDGVQLIDLLSKEGQTLPQALFLDLNMPRKNGVECLIYIKKDAKLKQLPVIILSTSWDKEFLSILHERGASFFFRKPNEFNKLKEVISKSIDLISQNNSGQISKDQFDLTEA